MFSSHIPRLQFAADKGARTPRASSDAGMRKVQMAPRKDGAAAMVTEGAMAPMGIVQLTDVTQLLLFSSMHRKRSAQARFHGFLTLCLIAH
jgi:hypothetical protein